MLDSVFQIEHHPTFRTGNCMYYVIYLRPIVDRVHFSEDIVLSPYFQLWENEIIPVYYFFRQSPRISAKFTIIMIMTGYYNYRLIFTFTLSLSTLMN